MLDLPYSHYKAYAPYLTYRSHYAALALIIMGVLGPTSLLMNGHIAFQPRLSVNADCQIKKIEYSCGY